MEFIAEKNNVKVTGRTLFQNNVRYLGYSCSAIEFVFTGQKAQAVLWTNSPSLEDIYTAWIAVFIDDEEEPSRRFSLNKEEETYLLYEGNEIKQTKIRMVKYSEATFGKVGVKSIMIDGSTPQPAPKKSRRLEFIGDSITCGYGNEGVWNTDIFSTAQENPWEAYAAITARTLGADYQLISWSGIGIISNWTDQDVPNDVWLMPGMYSYTDKETDLFLGNTEPEAWDNTGFIPDCIIINLGTNDASYTKRIPERVETFGSEYYKFLQQVRNVNPGVKILCTLGVMGQDLCPEVERQVKKLNLEGEDHIYYMKFDLQREKDGIGSDWHPSKITHNKMAEKLVSKLKEICDWE
jgi:Lysophospholipase L1 and related esterases